MSYNFYEIGITHFICNVVYAGVLLADHAGISQITEVCQGQQEI